VSDEPQAGAEPGIAADATVLGFDVGTRRIGVAIGNPLVGTAKSIGLVAVHAAGPDWDEVERLLKQWRPGGLIVGDPMTLDGGDQPIRKAAHAFARELRLRARLPVVLVDERNSSQDAARRFAEARASGRSRRREAEVLDALAAVVIVERWLAAPRDATSVA